MCRQGRLAGYCEKYLCLYVVPFMLGTVSRLWIVGEGV